MAALRRRGVDFLRKRVHITESLSNARGKLTIGPTKTHENRIVPLPPFLRELVEDHLSRFVRASSEALLFTSPTGVPLRYRTSAGMSGILRYFEQDSIRPASTRSGIRARPS